MKKELEDNKEVEFFEEEEVVTFTDENGNEVDYVIWGELDYNDKQYAVIQPLDLPEDMEQDQVIVCEIILSEEGQEEFVFVEDEELGSAIVEEYNKLQEEAEEE